MKQKARTKRRRFREIEPLEKRQMLAADCGFDSSESIEIASVTDLRALSSDAGGTLATARDLGMLDGEATRRGRVGGWDRADVFRFQTDQDAAVEIDLTGLSRNANLTLQDADGDVLESSRQRGRRSESIQLDLSAGEFYVAVTSGTFWKTRYQLTIHVSATAPPVSNPPSIVDGATEAPSSNGGDASTGNTNDAVDSEHASNTDNVIPFANVAYFGGSRDWNLNAINAPEAWNQGFTGEGVTVAIVDTGVDLDHADLDGNLWVNEDEIAGNGIDDDGNGFVDDRFGWDFAGRDNNPNDNNGHGTHVAGSVAAELNGLGATGVAYNATIMPIRVLGNNGLGSTFDVAAGIRYAADNGADIINLSLGGGTSSAIASAISYAGRKGALVVAAAGNEAAAAPGFPARYSAALDHVISVGAHTSRGSVAGFSNRVGTSGAVQVDAPGASIYSTFIGGGFATLSGTSMAAPHVSGLAALALSAAPNLQPAELRSLLVGGVASAATGSDAVGTANAASSIAYAAAGLKTSPNANVSQSSELQPIGRLSRFMIATGNFSAAPLTFNLGGTDNEPVRSVSDSHFETLSVSEVAQFETSEDAASADRIDLAIASAFSGEDDSNDEATKFGDLFTEAALASDLT